MHLRRKPLVLTALGAVALWLGLWPALETVPHRAVTAAPAPVTCCEMEVAVDDGSSCCGVDCSKPENLPCPGTPSSSSCPCFGQGHFVCIGCSTISVAAGSLSTGTIHLADEVGSSRSIRPPVPPPLDTSLTSC
jgi:hypothetical protein